MEEDIIKKYIEEEMTRCRKNYCIIYFSTNPNFKEIKFPIIKEFKNGKEVKYERSKSLFNLY